MRTIKSFSLFSVILGLLVCYGCASSSSIIHKAPHETPQEAISAVGTMTQGLTNAPVSQEDLRRVALEAQNNPQVQQAVSGVEQALTRPGVGVKYCPVDGKRYSSQLKTCPVCGSELKDLD